MYDVIIVGSRCAGAPTAMLLARQGRRVLVVERGPARFGGDDGSLNIMIGDGWSYLFAIDT